MIDTYCIYGIKHIFIFQKSTDPRKKKEEKIQRVLRKIKRSFFSRGVLNHIFLRDMFGKVLWHSQTS